MPNKRQLLKKDKGKRKFRLLFDVTFAHPFVFKRLAKKSNLAHVRHTYNLSPQAEDEHIYQIAQDTERIIVTQDVGFKMLVKPKKPGIFVIPSYLSNEKIDKILTKFISDKNPEDYEGKVTKIS